MPHLVEDYVHEIAILFQSGHVGSIELHESEHRQLRGRSNLAGPGLCKCPKDSVNRRDLDVDAEIIDGAGNRGLTLGTTVGGDRVD